MVCKSVEYVLKKQKSMPSHIYQEEIQDIDLRTGVSFTRFQTILLKDAFVFNFYRWQRPCSKLCSLLVSHIGRYKHPNLKNFGRSIHSYSCDLTHYFCHRS